MTILKMDIAQNLDCDRIEECWLIEKKKTVEFSRVWILEYYTKVGLLILF